MKEKNTWNFVAFSKYIFGAIFIFLLLFKNIFHKFPETSTVLPFILWFSWQLCHFPSNSGNFSELPEFFRKICLVPPFFSSINKTLSKNHRNEHESYSKDEEKVTNQKKYHVKWWKFDGTRQKIVAHFGMQFLWDVFNIKWIHFARVDLLHYWQFIIFFLFR